MNKDALQAYLFAAGDRHPAVKTVKAFLNAHPRVKASDLPPTDAFDERTRAAVADYQRYKRLSSSDGAMTIDTYRAIGDDMHWTQADLAAMRDPVLGLLLASGGSRVAASYMLPGDGGTPLPRCAQKGIYEFFKANGNSSQSRLRTIEDALKKVIVSYTGFPVTTPPGAALKAQAATDAVGGEGAYEKMMGSNPKNIHGYTASATRVYFAKGIGGEPMLRTSAGLSLMVHEFTHVMQYLEEPNFTVNYIREVMRGAGTTRYGGNRFERRGYINQDKSEKFFNSNPQLLCDDKWSDN